MQDFSQSPFSLVAALVFASALFFAGCTAGSITGPDTQSDSPEVVNVTPDGPSGERNVYGNGDGSTTHTGTRNEVNDDKEDD